MGVLGGIRPPNTPFFRSHYDFLAGNLQGHL